MCKDHTHARPSVNALCSVRRQRLYLLEFTLDNTARYQDSAPREQAPCPRTVFAPARPALAPPAAGVAGTSHPQKGQPPASTQSPHPLSRSLGHERVCRSQRIAIISISTAQPCRRRDAVPQVSPVRAHRPAGKAVAGPHLGARAPLVQRRSAGRQPSPDRSDERAGKVAHVRSAARGRLCGDRGGLPSGVAAGLRFHSPHHRRRPHSRWRRHSGALPGPRGAH